MITIENALKILKNDHNFREIIDKGEYYYNITDVTFDNISYDSRDVTASTLFFVKGNNFKKEFLGKAVESGLRFYVSETDFEVTIPVILVNDVKQAMSLLAMEFYGNPQDKLKLLAFTGTKGKTTSDVYKRQAILNPNGQSEKIIC